MAAPVMHWDDVPGRRRGGGHLGGTWHDLGRAIGAVDVGLRRILLPPGTWSTPAHRHLAEEEIHFLLAGDGISWQDGEAFEVRAGDCLVHLAGAEAHTLRAGPNGLDVLAFGERVAPGSTAIPRAAVAWHGTTWIEAGVGPNPFERDEALGPPDVPDLSPRPARILNLDAVADKRFGQGERVRAVRRDLGREAGSVRTGLSHVEVAPGAWNAPAHCHAAEEELFVVLAGDGVLELGNEEHPVRPGSIVSRPPGTGVAHAFRAGPRGLTLLAYGNRKPHDMTYYPRSDKVYLRGLRLIGRIERLDYWDGE
ncbi:MAG: cupin domain-containing protein [Thermoleophilia bacterium]